MEQQNTYTKGDRVRVVCDCPGARAGDAGDVVAVHQAELQAVEVIDVLINHDPPTAHGVTVYPHEIEPVASEP